MQDMVKRQIQRLLKKRMRDYPAVMLIGPRQCGKTTLARTMGSLYFDLEQGSDRLRLDLEWDRLISGKELVILDEAQSWPEVFNRLRGAIDQDRKRMGRFLLLGSVSPSLMIQVSESLSGRLSRIELTPFLLTELKAPLHRKRRWLYGGYPDGGVLKQKQYPRWQLDYLALLTQRDLPNWGLPAKPQTTDRLLQMLAAVHGQVWNGSQIGQSMGLSYKTVNSYLDYLSGTFLIRKLQPFQTNIRKRLIKSPKVYWRDSGLLHALLNLPDAATLLTRPWVGASWEGFVIEQALNELSVHEKNCNAYYFRSSDQYELDLVLDFGKELWAVEIKLTSSPSPEEMRRLNKTADMIKATRRFLVSQTNRSIGYDRCISCNLPSFLDHLRSANASTLP